MLKSAVFTDELHDQMGRAEHIGRTFVLINSWELHSDAGGVLGKNSSLPICRIAMRKEMQTGDVLLFDSGSGLSIRYLLPRKLNA